MQTKNTLCQKGDTVYETLYYSYRCLSSIGLQNDGPQQIILGSGCGTLPTILHEMMHAIGFLHEQSREDRDEYVAVQYENIDPGTY